MSAAAAHQNRIHNTTAEGQIAKANELLRELAEINGDYANQVWAELKSAWAQDSCSFRFVSSKIVAMLEAKKASRHLFAVPAERPTTPSGRYAITGPDGATKFYRVVNENGRITLFVYASSEQHLVSNWKNITSILKQIEADGLKAAAKRFGNEMGSCSECGRPLTDEVSRELGIGPVCRNK
jgi:hypothetical protein